jgi:hypothetical protein
MKNKLSLIYSQTIFTILGLAGFCALGSGLYHMIFTATTDLEIKRWFFILIAGIFVILCSGVFLRLLSKDIKNLP